MSAFDFKLMTGDGAVSEGVLEAADEKAAIEQIRRMGAIPLMVVPKKTGLGKRFGSNASKGDLQIFTAELAVLLGEHLPLDKSLGILAEISESARMRETVRTILKSIREGSSFSEALTLHPRTFPKFYVNMIKAGEASGVLDEVLDKLTEFLESTRELKEHVFSAMIYPMILMVVGIVSIVILVAFRAAPLFRRSQGNGRQHAGGRAGTSDNQRFSAGGLVASFGGRCCGWSPCVEIYPFR